MKNSGITTKLLQIINTTNETSDTIVSLIIDGFTVTNLLSKCVGYPGDNCNTNFGGHNRVGVNNVLQKLKDKISDKLVGVGCPVHIAHNEIHCGLNQLSINVNGIVLALYNHFSIFTVRVEKLKEFCDFVGTEFKMLLYHSKTRWLSLLPAVNRILEITF